MRVRVYVSEKEMGIPNEGKPMCVVVGEWGDGIQIIMIFQEYSLWGKKSNSSQANENIEISLNSSR